jgi:hypothetical protein
VFDSNPLDFNSNFKIDIEKFLGIFWVALHISDSQFGAPYGAETTTLADISTGTAFADAFADAFAKLDIQML